MSLGIIFGGIIVLAFCAFLFWLAGIVAINRERAEAFLSAYGSSARAHYTEQVGRLIAGAGLVLFSSQMWFSDLLLIFGWVLVATSIGLLILPWQLHHKFAQLVVPPTIRFIYFYAFGAFALGAFLLYSFSRVLL